jgi:2,5-diketo-D-gluconate reductase B
MLNAVQAAGKTKFIGVSNQNIAQLKQSIALSKVPIVTSQIELHPYLDQHVMAEAAQAAGVAITAYFGMADGKVPSDPLIQEIGKMHGKSAAQVGLRWSIQQGFVVLSKTAKPERVAENFAVFDFQLSPEEMASISKLAHADGRLVSPPGLAPDWNA